MVSDINTEQPGPSPCELSSRCGGRWADEAECANEPLPEPLDIAPPQPEDEELGQGDEDNRADDVE